MKIGFAGNLEKQGIAEVRSARMAHAGSGVALDCDCAAFDSVEAVRSCQDMRRRLLVVVGGDGSLLALCRRRGGSGGSPDPRRESGHASAFLNEVAAGEFRAGAGFACFSGATTASNGA